MRRSLSLVKRPFAAGVAVALALSGTAASAAEVDQIAQSALFGLSGKALRACYGRPERRRGVALASIWTYPMGTLTADGPAFFFPLDLNLLNAGGLCEVHFVVGRFGVSQVFYTLPGSRALPPGQTCDFPAEVCAGR